jgi:hypothetical protein
MIVVTLDRLRYDPGLTRLVRVYVQSGEAIYDHSRQQYYLLFRQM